MQIQWNGESAVTKKKLKQWLETVESPVAFGSKLVVQIFSVDVMLVSDAANAYVKCVRKAELA